MKMPEDRYEDPSHAVIHSVSSLLASNGIGYLLWGEHLLRTYASSIKATDYKFLLEDGDIHDAYDVLLTPNPSPKTKFTFIKCTGTYPCPLVYRIAEIAETNPHPSKYHDLPETHVNLHENSKNPYPTVIGLYLKTAYLPIRKEGLSSVIDPPRILPTWTGRLSSHGRFIFADEIGPCPSRNNHGGRFPRHFGQKVLLPSPMYLIETLILLGNRDSRVPGARNIWTHWLSELRLAYLDHGRGVAAWDEKMLLPEALRPIWRGAIDAEVSVFDEPVMDVWRDLAWNFAGVEVGIEERWSGHLGYDEGMVRWSRWSGEW